MSRWSTPWPTTTATTALGLRRAQFAYAPTVATYQKLQHAAQALDAWPAVCGDALKLLWPATSRPGDAVLARGSVLLVEALLWEQSTDQAWQVAHNTMPNPGGGSS